MFPRKTRRTPAPRWVLALLAVLLLVLAACGPPSVTEDDVIDDETPPTTAPSSDGDGESDNADTTDTDTTAGNQPGIEVASDTVEVDDTGVTVGFTTAGYPFRGDPAAPVVMEEFSDFQCPYCSRFFEQTLPTLEENQIAGGEVVLVFYDFPLSNLHPQADAAHNAARCAAEEGAAAYWAMHDALFANLEEWNENSNATTLFTGYAEEIGLDATSFGQCLDENRYQDEIAASVSTGRERGVNSTPSFFLNGQLLPGAQPIDVFNQVISRVRAGESIAGNDEAAEPQQPAAAPTPATISDEYAAALGDPNAPVTIVEYTDYQCPYCLRYASQTLPQVIGELVDTGRVYYIVKDFPLDSIHPKARAAAAAARCAGDQDAYWEMHDALFENQQEWAQAGDAGQAFADLAAELDLDTGDFNECVASGRYDDAVETNFQEGRQLGVNGTPAFFINGYPVVGARPYDLFEYAVGLAEEGTLADAYTQQPEQQPTPTPRPAGAVEVPLGDAPSIGDPDAPVTIVEYTDFQCPFCSRHFQQTYPQIVENFVETGQVRYVFKDFPLTQIHPQAVVAAEAARCADDQGAFLEMHDMLFAQQQEWSGKSNAIEIFTGYAEELGLDADTFAECVNSHRYEDAVMADLREGVELGVTGTPAFFVNGHFVSGAQPYQVFEQAINQLLDEE